jgi:hypothetical protein
MVKSILFLACALFLNCSPVAAQTTHKHTEPAADASFSGAVGRWFAAWELICRDVYRVKNSEPVEFVFFDGRYVYSTSNATVAEGETVSGPTLFGQSFVRRKALRHNFITLPDRQTVPIGLMSFASAAKDVKSTAFFVTPLPSFRLKANVKSAE